jgi:hypothetical protein
MNIRVHLHCITLYSGWGFFELKLLEILGIGFAVGDGRRGYASDYQSVCMLQIDLPYRFGTRSKCFNMSPSKK